MRGKEQSPLAIPFSEFGAMGHRGKIELNKQAAGVVGQRVHGIFNRDQKLDWLIVYGPEIEVMKPRTNHPLPTPEALLRFGRRVGTVPFLFTKPVSFEEFRTSYNPLLKTA